MDLFNISAAEPGKNSRIPITRPGDSGEVFHEPALEMTGAIRAVIRQAAYGPAAAQPF